MNIYLGIKYHSDGANRDRIEMIADALEPNGHPVTCVFRDLEAWGQHKFPPNELMARTFEIISACDLTLIDLTEKGVGLGIEAGYAHAIGKPVITIASQGSDISETLSGISKDIIHYTDAVDLYRNLQPVLTR